MSAGHTFAAPAAGLTHLILRRAASGTTLWRVGETLAGEERLLTGAKGESASAIDAFQFLIR